MNKKTTLLGVLGLVAVSGAGYLYSTGQGTQVVQQVSSYLPESVRGYLPASFSPVQEEQNVAVTTEAEQASEVLTQAEPMDSDTDNKLATVDEESIDNDVLGEIEQTIAEPAVTAEPLASQEPSAGQEPSVSQEPLAITEPTNKSQEILALEKQLQEVTNKIANLDGEKAELEDKFQNVLKKNRSLAIKLKDIDDQLKNNMQ